MYQRNKRFSLYEFTYAGGTKEADDQQQQQQPQDAAPDMEGGTPGGDPNMGDADPNMGGGMAAGDPNMGGDMPQGDQNVGGGMPQGDPNMAQGLDIPDDGMGDFGGEIEDVDMDDNFGPMQPEDEVIDVDELTDAQEDASQKIDGVDNKLTVIGQVVQKFIDAIKQNDEKIEDLKAEFEKRNPTQQEKFNIRSQASGPFTESPKEFWDKKVAQNPNYQVMYNNEVPTKDEQQEFEIRRTDIDGAPDKEVVDSFEYPTRLKDVLDF